MAKAMVRDETRKELRKVDCYVRSDDLWPRFLINCSTIFAHDSV